MFQIEVKKDSEAPDGVSKYDDVYRHLFEAQADEWVVLSGFKDESEMRSVQSAIRGGSSDRKVRQHGFALKTRGFKNNNGRAELWLKAIPIEQS